MMIKNLEIELIQCYMTIISRKKVGGKKELKIVTSVMCATTVLSRAKVSEALKH